MFGAFAVLLLVLIGLWSSRAINEQLAQLSETAWSNATNTESGFSSVVRNLQNSSPSPSASFLSTVSVGKGSIKMDDLSPSLQEQITDDNDNVAVISPTNFYNYYAGNGTPDDGSVTASKMADNAVGSSTIIDNSIASDDIASDAVQTDEIADNAVTTGKIGDGAVTWTKLSDDSVNTNNIVDSSVTAAKVAPQSITNIHLTDWAVDERVLADGSVTAAKLAGAIITSAEIADGTITASDIANGAISTAQIADGAITPSKLSANARVKTVSTPIADISSSSPTVERPIFVAPTDGTITRIRFVVSADVNTAANQGTLSVERKSPAAATVASQNLTTTGLTAFTSASPSVVAGETFSAGDVYSFKYVPGSAGVAINGLNVIIEYELSD